MNQMPTCLWKFWLQMALSLDCSKCKIGLGHGALVFDLLFRVKRLHSYFMSCSPRLLDIMLWKQLLEVGSLANAGQRLRKCLGVWAGWVASPLLALQSILRWMVNLGMHMAQIHPSMNKYSKVYQLLLLRKEPLFNCLGFYYSGYSCEALVFRTRWRRRG